MTIASLKQEIARLRELEKKATPKPWMISQETINGKSMGVGPICGYDFNALNQEPKDPDLLLTSILRNSLPRLLAILEAALEVVEAAREIVDRANAHDAIEPNSDYGNATSACANIVLAKLQAFDKIVGER